MSTRRSLANLLSASLAVGRVSSRKDKLPDQMPDQGIQLGHFAGTFKLGEDAITDLGLFTFVRERYAGETLTLLSSDSKLTVTYYSSDGTTESTVIDTTTKVARLREGRLSYQFPHFDGVNLEISYLDRRGYMYLEPNGNLVVAVSGTETGMAFLVLPFQESYRSVYRFRKTTS